MALQQSITNDAGETASYWRISELYEKFPAASVILEGYVSQQYREADKAVDHRTYSVAPDLTRTQLYDFIKTQPEFASSTDV